MKGVGPKSYEQCIGFLRVYPSTAQRQRVKSTNSGMFNVKMSRSTL